MVVSGKRTCYKCKIEKEDSEFYKKCDTKDGIGTLCKSCSKIKSSEYRRTHPELKLYNREYYSKNKKTVQDQQKVYQNKNRQAINEKRRPRLNLQYKTNEIYHVKELCRRLIRLSFDRGGYKKATKTASILGCTFEMLNSHLISTAIKNYGKYDPENSIYEIDHIIPLASAKSIEDIVKLNHYTNLQYLTRKDNQEKSDKLDWKIGDKNGEN